MNWLWKGKGGDKTKDKPKEKPQEEEEVDEDQLKKKGFNPEGLEIE